VAGDEEIRVLLRGLLRLHRVRVDGEADGATEGVRLLHDRHPTLLVIDQHLREGRAVDFVTAARRALPSCRIVLIVPAARPPPTLDLAAAPDVVLQRPFRIREFADAIGPPPTTGPRE